MQSQPVSKSKKTEYDIFFQIVKELKNKPFAPKSETPDNHVASHQPLATSRCDCLVFHASRATRSPGIPGGGERDRTDDPLLAKQVLSQLSYTPIILGGSGWSRTNDPRLIKTVL